MSIPIFDLADDGHNLVAALAEHGACFVRDRSIPADTFPRALADASAYFDVPDAELAAIAIENSPHFRGYSVMHNERDWREQAHFGRELAAMPSGGPNWDRLQGPNQWPPSAAWRQRMTTWLAITERAGCRALDSIAAACASSGDTWLGGDPYLVAKLIAYHPQVSGGPARPGVAAHVDFSLLTLTLQDAVGGLQVQRPDGSWVDVAPRPGAWLLHAGELLEYVTGGRVRATPHRVVNPSIDRTRYSLPFFLCPSLGAELCPGRPAASARSAPATEHVHAVLDPAAPPPAIAFGPAEWRRKGENVWCRECCEG